MYCSIAFAVKKVLETTTNVNNIPNNWAIQLLIPNVSAKQLSSIKFFATIELKWIV